MPPNLGLARLLLLLCLALLPGVAAQEDAGASDVPADAAAEPEAADAPAAEAGSVPAKPRPKKKPGMMISVVTAAGSVGLPRNTTKATSTPIPDCGTFDSCILTGESPDVCCKEHLDSAPRTCGICARAACTLRVDSCPPADTDAQVDKYCGICWQIAGAAGAAKSQASVKRAQMAPPSNPVPKGKPTPSKKKPRPDDPAELRELREKMPEYRKAKKKDRDDQYDRDRRDRYDRYDRYDRERYDRERYDRDRFDRDRFDRYERDDRDLDRYSRDLEDRLRDEYGPKRSKSKGRPKPESYDPRRYEM